LFRDGLPRIGTQYIETARCASRSSPRTAALVPGNATEARVPTLFDMQRRVVFEHLAEIAEIERHTAIRAGHEVLGRTLGRLVDKLSDVLSARGLRA
jgi:hypothetical protein